MNDIATKDRRQWLAKVQRLRIKRNRQMATPIHEPMTPRIQQMLRGMSA